MALTAITLCIYDCQLLDIKPSRFRQAFIDTQYVCLQK